MKLYTAAEAAQLLNLSARTLRWYFKMYGYGQKRGRDILFDDADLERIREHIGKPGPKTRK